MRRAAYPIAVLILTGTLTGALSGQTYNPKAIQFESTDPKRHIDPTELLRISGLHQGAPLTKDEIEAALQKLADSGDFTNLTYSVNNTALTIRLTPSAALQVFPVRFVNFVWWQQDELLQLLAKRVPLFHGEIPLQGNQTGDVEDVLVGLLSEKGIPNARITAAPSSTYPGEPMNAVALSITSPDILVGDIQFDGSVPAVAEKFTALARKLAGRNFDFREVNETIQDNVHEIFADLGYLDGTSDSPVLVTPRKDSAGYAVDVHATVHPGNLYRIGSLELHSEPPATDAELRAAIPFKVGDPASAADVRTAVEALARVYSDHGYLRARASANLKKNVSNATVAYSFTFSPGDPFRLASIDTSGLPGDLQQEFASLWHDDPGTLIDKEFQSNLRQTLEKLHTHYGIFVAAKSDPVAHTVVIILQLRKVPAAGANPSDPAD